MPPACPIIPLTTVAGPYRSAPGAPPLFAIALNQSTTAALAWTAPSGALGYVLLNLAGLAILGNSDIVCGVPGGASPILAGHAAARARSAATTTAPVSLDQAKQRLRNAVPRIAGSRTIEAVRQALRSRSTARHPLKR